MSAGTWLSRVFARRQAYRLTFLGDRGDPHESAKVVLADLASFCCADRVTYRVGANGIDTHAMAVAEGRREVWLRLQRHLNMSDRDLSRLQEQQQREGNE